MDSDISHPALIVDDEPAVRRSVRRMLERSGWQVSESPALVDALVQIERVTPMLLVTDLHMPGGDGLDLARAVRRAGRGQPGIILLSGDSGTDITAECEVLGAIPLMKPFERTELLLAVSQALLMVESARGDSRQDHDSAAHHSATSKGIHSAA